MERWSPWKFALERRSTSNSSEKIMSRRTPSLIPLDNTKDIKSVTFRPRLHQADFSASPAYLFPRRINHPHPYFRGALFAVIIAVLDGIRYSPEDSTNYSACIFIRVNRSRNLPPSTWRRDGDAIRHQPTPCWAGIIGVGPPALVWDVQRSLHELRGPETRRWIRFFVPVRMESI